MRFYYTEFGGGYQEIAQTVVVTPLGELFRIAREAQDLSQGQVASEAKLTANGLSLIETGKTRKPQANTIAALVGALGCGSIDELRRLYDPKLKELQPFSGHQRRVPVLSSFPTGVEGGNYDIEAHRSEETLLGWYLVDADVDDTRVFGLRITGSSMLPVLPEGSKAICSPASFERHGFTPGLWYAIRYRSEQGDEKTTVIIVERVDEERIRLVPRNENHPSVVIHDNQVVAAAEVIEYTAKAPSRTRPGGQAAAQDYALTERELRDAAQDTPETRDPDGGGAA